MRPPFAPQPVRQKPRPDPRLLDARKALAAGDTARARALIGAVLKQAPNSADALAGLAFVCRAERDPAGALDAVEAALKASPDSPALIAARAEVLADLGRIQDASAAYDRLIARAPSAPKPRADKAHMLQLAGAFEAAEAEFRKALKIAPDDGELYRIFLQAKKLGPGDPLIAAMERAWKKPGLPARSRAHLGFALAKAMEDSGQYDRVFSYLRPANQGLRRLHPFDIAERERQYDALTAAFRGVDFSRDRAAGPGGFGPIFVTGLPRSGTTLVEQIVSSHPQVSGGGEMGILFAEALRLMGRPGGGFTPLADLPADSLAGLARSYEARARKALDFDARFTDKSIQTDLLIGLVRRVLPSARILVVNRDPRDTLLSIYKNVFMPGKHLYAYDLRDLGRYYRAWRRVLSFWRDALPDAFHEVRYEDLVADPEPQSRAMVQAAALDWHADCLNFTENRRAVKTLSTHQVRQPLYASSIGAWRRYEGELGELLDELDGEI